MEPGLLSWPLGSLHWGGLWASASPLLALGHPHSPGTPVPLNPIVGTSSLPPPPELLAVPAGHIWQPHRESKHTETKDSHSVPAWLSSYNFFTGAPVEDGEMEEFSAEVMNQTRVSLWSMATIWDLHIWKIHSQKHISSLRSQSPLLAPNLPRAPLPSKSPWHTAKKWHQLINIHEPFTWARLCVLQGLIQTETRLFCSSADCVTPPFVGETHQLVFQGNVSPHWEPNLPPLSPSSSCAPSVLRAGSSIS